APEALRAELSGEGRRGEDIGEEDLPADGRDEASRARGERRVDRDDVALGGAIDLVARGEEVVAAGLARPGERLQGVLLGRDLVPDGLLALEDLGLLADAGAGEGLVGPAEGALARTVARAERPAAVLDAEDLDREAARAGREEHVAGEDAVL